MDPIPLSHANHFVLRKHHLTEDAKGDDITKIVKDIGGLHSTHPLTPYLSLFARKKKFKREDFDEIFNE